LAVLRAACFFFWAGVCNTPERGWKPFLKFYRLIREVTAPSDAESNRRWSFSALTQGATQGTISIELRGFSYQGAIRIS